MMTAKEVKALEILLNYIDLDGWKYLDSENLTSMLSDYIKGLHSTGCLNHESN